MREKPGDDCLWYDDRTEEEHDCDAWWTPGYPDATYAACAVVNGVDRKQLFIDDGTARWAVVHRWAFLYGGGMFTNVLLQAILYLRAAMLRGLAGRSDSRLMAAIDDSLTVEQACTLPTTWCTVHMSLLASRPRAGHHALLQAGAGGVGLAAGEYTHWVGTRASVTVGRPYKHWYLHGMGLRGETLSSRDGGAFLAGAAALVRASRLRFVLNSLSADFIAGSFALLGEGGCLCEIGKRLRERYPETPAL